MIYEDLKGYARPCVASLCYVANVAKTNTVTRKTPLEISSGSQDADIRYSRVVSGPLNENLKLRLVCA